MLGTVLAQMVFTQPISTEQFIVSLKTQKIKIHFGHFYKNGQKHADNLKLTPVEFIYVNKNTFE